MKPMSQEDKNIKTTLPLELEVTPLSLLPLTLKVTLPPLVSIWQPTSPTSIFLSRKLQNDQVDIHGIGVLHFSSGRLPTDQGAYCTNIFSKAPKDLVSTKI
jgi:hypothetical protein